MLASVIAFNANNYNPKRTILDWRRCNSVSSTAGIIIVELLVRCPYLIPRCCALWKKIINVVWNANFLTGFCVAGSTDFIVTAQCTQRKISETKQIKKQADRALPVSWKVGRDYAVAGSITSLKIFSLVMRINRSSRLRAVKSSNR